jgi:CheY-like chemotaxis protein
MEGEQKIHESKENPPQRALIIDDSVDILAYFGQAFKKNEYVFTAECHSVEQAIDAITSLKPDIIFLDNTLGAEGNEGLKVADIVKTQWPHVKIYSTTSDVRESVLAEYEKRDIPLVSKSSYVEMLGIISDSASKEV